MYANAQLLFQELQLQHSGLQATGIYLPYVGQRTVQKQLLHHSAVSACFHWHFFKCE